MTENLFHRHVTERRIYSVVTTVIHSLSLFRSILFIEDRYIGNRLFLFSKPFRHRTAVESFFERTAIEHFRRDRELLSSSSRARARARMSDSYRRRRFFAKWENDDYPFVFPFPLASLLCYRCGLLFRDAICILFAVRRAAFIFRTCQEREDYG